MSELKFVIIPLLCAIVSQVIEFIVESLKNSEVDLERLLDRAWGMPSSHSALVASLTTVIALNEGITSPIFAVSLIFAFVVIYDAMGVRYETGKQAVIINQLTKKMNLKKQFQQLKEKVGHKPIEVLLGTLLGITLAIILNSII